MDQSEAVSQQSKPWQPRGQDFDAGAHRSALLAIFEAVRSSSSWGPNDLARMLAQYPQEGKGYFSKLDLVAGYRQMVASGEFPLEMHVLRRLQLKPVRTASGVAPVTVLTEPAGCPGHCIFCPDDSSMPKSYLPNEPGARRAAQNGFDPYRQVQSRLSTLDAMGHTAQKVELLVLGGTWGAYSRHYREWFVRRCLDAMNGREASSVEEAQAWNEDARFRNVGLVVETRPDFVTPREIVHMRRLGVTKVQLGVQSLDDRILSLNRRGHDVAAVRSATNLLRAAGFKLHLHWMPNLYGATPESDLEDFARLWDDPALRPDELKIYPCSIIAGTRLHELWQAGEYRPYEEEELVPLVAQCKSLIPPYCRVNRVFRDIPAPDIVAGTKRSNLRQVVGAFMDDAGMRCRCIRCREIQRSAVVGDELRPVVHEYLTAVSQEQFVSYETAEGKLAGFVRLSLPLAGAPTPVDEVAGSAMIRELHVYGPALAIGAANNGEPQHGGLGRQLVGEAVARAHAAGFHRLAVIAAIGTRRYYEALGFERGELYMSMPLD